MAEDTREQPLNDAARKIMAQSNYDPHFSAIEERVIMETKLFLARLDAVRGFDVPYRGPPKIFEGQTDGTREVVLPTPMILWCPNCGVQHVDNAEPHKPDCGLMVNHANPSCTCDNWQNPPHRSHLCAYCKHIWRPTADVPTTGVHEIAGRLGSKDSQPVIRRLIDKAARFLPQWRLKRRGTLYVELGRGHLQVSGQHDFAEGTRIVAYRGEDNRIWFRAETEFDDGRFEKIDAP